MIIDATDLRIGRLASFAAKKALLGEEIIIVNSENAIVTGKRQFLISHYKQKRARGKPLKGPYFPKRADMILRRTIRGMLPHRQQKGKEAYKRVMCYLGIPEELKSKKIETIESANIKHAKTLDYMRLGEIAHLIGARL